MLSIDPAITKAVSKLSRNEVSLLLSDIEGYTEPLVDINQFINDPQYLGNILRDERGKTKLFSIWVEALNKIFPNPYYSPYYECLSGDTLIDLLDGRQLTIKDIVDEVNRGCKLYTISYDVQNKSIVPGKILAGRKTGKKFVYKITLDNGKFFEATGNHLLLALDKKYRRVDTFKKGSKLLPFNTKEGKYREIQDPDTGEWRKLYDIVSTWKCGINRNLQTHHKDLNSQNDTPENLSRISRDDHFRFHNKMLGRIFADPEKRDELITKLSEGQKKSYVKDPSRRVKASEHFQALWSADDDKMITAVRSNVEKKMARYYSDEDFRKEQDEISASHLRDYNKTLTKEQIKERTDHGRNLLHFGPAYEGSRNKRKESLSIYMRESGQAKRMNQLAQQYFKDHPEVMEGNRQRILNCNSDPEFQRRCQRGKLINKAYKVYVENGDISYNEEIIIKYFDSVDEFKQCVRSHNHKVIKIEEIGEKEVYDIEVEKYHNFALSCGVFSHNCAFSGSIGAGKSSVGRIILIYDLYKLLMLRNPFSKYQLIASDAIVMALFTANLTLARLVLYRPFRELVRSSPFFMEKLLNQKKLNEGGSIEFPSNISIQAGSRFTHALGLAIFCLKGDTKIPLLDGRAESIESIVNEFESNKDMYTYSLDIKTKSIVPGKIIKAVNNGCRPVYRVYFDNDKYVDATANHPILMSFP